MSGKDTFDSAISSIYTFLSISRPNAKQDIVSFLIDGQEIHITEYTDGQILMYAELPTELAPVLSEFGQQNIFSENPLKPVLGWSENTKSWVLWSRQSLTNTSDVVLKMQLEELSRGVDRLWLTKHKNKIEKEQNSTETSSNFLIV